MAIVDPEWGTRLQEIKDLDKKNIEEILKEISNILLQNHPIIVCRMNLEKIKNKLGLSRAKLSLASAKLHTSLSSDQLKLSMINYTYTKLAEAL